MPTYAQRIFAFLIQYNSSGCPEGHYLHSKYIAEFYCTLTNIGFFIVGCYFQDYATLAVAIFSTISHALPLKGLILLDILVANLVLLKVLSAYTLVIAHPNIIIAGVVTFIFGILDKFVGRKHLHIFGGLFHSIWHLSAAIALFNFNQASNGGNM